MTASNEFPVPSTSLTTRIPVNELAPYYTHILFAYGANESRPLGIPGSGPKELRNVFAALDFVEWYNGHPDAHDPAHQDAYSLNQVDGSKVNRVAVVGAGNVALDVARVLLRQSAAAPDKESLAQTDVPESVLAALRTWNVEEVNLYVRRGVAQVAFTNKELRELLNLSHVPFRPVPQDLLDTGIAQVNKLTEAGQRRAMNRLLGQLKKGSRVPFEENQAHKPRWGLHLLRSPAALHGDDSSPATLCSVDWNVTEVSPTGRAESKGETVSSNEDLLIASVGYRSTPLEGVKDPPMQVPFDTSRHIIPNIRNRVVDSEGNILPGMFVSGWLATGPVGVIVSTMFDAFGVADELVKEWHTNPPNTASMRTFCGQAGFTEPLREMPQAVRASERVISYEQWLTIDRAELARGKKLGKSREKFLTVADMLRVIE